MREIRATLFISLDGVVDRMEHWHFEYFNDEMGAAVDRVMSTADTFLLGRVTYDSFAGAWPKVEAEGEGEDAEFAKHLGDARGVGLPHGDQELVAQRVGAEVPARGQPALPAVGAAQLLDGHIQELIYTPTLHA